MGDLEEVHCEKDDKNNQMLCQGKKGKKEAEVLFDMTPAGPTTNKESGNVKVAKALKEHVQGEAKILPAATKKVDKKPFGKSENFGDL